MTNNDGTRAVVRALEIRGGKVYIGGQFANVDGQARGNVASVDAATGAVSSFCATVGDSDSVVPGLSVVHGLAADATRLYVGGTFASVDGTTRGNLAALDPSSGALDAAWRPRTNRLVRKLEFDPSGATLFAEGGFNSATGSDRVKEARQSVARFDAATGNVHPWAASPGAIDTDSGRNGNMTCWTATVTPTRLYLGCGLGPNFAVGLRLDNDNSGDRVWRLGLVGNPVSSAISPDGSRLILGRHFGINPLDQRVCGGRYLKGLVALDPVAAESVGASGAIDCSWIPSLDQNSRPDYDGAWDLMTGGNRLWVGGGFVGVSGVPQSNLARFTYDPDRDAEPTITRPRPAPGAEIRDRTPTVRATVRDETDELGSPDIDLYVDGAPKAFSYDEATDRLSHATGRLSYGRGIALGWRPRTQRTTLRPRPDPSGCSGNAKTYTSLFTRVRGKDDLPIR